MHVKQIVVICEPYTPHTILKKVTGNHTQIDRDVVKKRERELVLSRAWYTGNKDIALTKCQAITGTISSSLQEHLILNLLKEWAKSP